LLVPIRLIAKATPGEEDEQQRTGAEYYDIDPLPAPVDNRCSPSTDDKLRGDEQANQTAPCIAKPMGERGEQHTSPRVIEDVLSLSEAALAEMRALIFELRPESLETEGLVAALTKQGAALHARHSITVQTDLCEEPDLPLKVKQELYRIAQEALHNIVKHARASSVYLRLSRTDKEIVLEVRDDGVGFDPTRAFPGHLGLRSMQERIRNLSGTFQIESVPGQGTCIRVCILVM
jgi:signal transduction histidine kinase